MRIIAVTTLRSFWEAIGDAEEPLKAWFREAKAADWDTPHDVKAAYGHASVMPGVYLSTDASLFAQLAWYF